MDNTMEAAVQRGMELLDEVRPGWELKIDLGRLDLANVCTCVLGQLEGHFFRGMAKLCPPGERTFPYAAERGFVIFDGVPSGFDYFDRHDAYEQLTETWRTALKQRMDEGLSTGF